MITFILNRDGVRASLPSGMVALDYLRAHAGLTGAKEGCREGDCGACMVLLGERSAQGMLYRAVNSCLLPLGELAGRHLVTIEGLNTDTLSPVQQAFVDEGATQCGFCTPGFIVSFAGFLLSSPRWDAASGAEALAGNLCRCTGHIAIRRAKNRLCADLPPDPPAAFAERLRFLVAGNWVPEYLLHIPGRLRKQAQKPARPGAIQVAGGTDLYVQRPEALAGSEVALLSRREALHGVRVEADRCSIGAGTTWAELEDSPVLQQVVPGIRNHLQLAASRPIRHRATIGGNIVNASPIGDLTILLLALDADLTLSDGVADRNLPLRHFFLGYKRLDKEPAELVTEISFQVPPPNAVLSFEKVSRRPHLDIASVNSAMLATRVNGQIDTLHLSAGGVAPVPLRLTRAAEALAGKPLTSANLRGAIEAADAEISPLSDVRGTAEYKRQLLRQLLRAHFLKLAPELEPELLA
jgi:xanthine dehydrogenase small subunit